MHGLIVNEIGETMTSVQLAELKGIRHSDVIRKITTIIGQLTDKDFSERNFALSSYTSTQSKDLPMYTMTKSGSLFIASRFDANLHLAVQLRWESLEEKMNQTHAIPTSLADALLLAGEQMKQKEIAEQQVEELSNKNTKLTSTLERTKPHVHLIETISFDKKGVTIAEYAKSGTISGIGKNILYDWLRQHGHLEKKYRLDGSTNTQYNLPTQYALNNKWLTVRLFEYTDEFKNRKTSREVLVTGKGQLYYADKVEKLFKF